LNSASCFIHSIACSMSHTWFASTICSQTWESLQSYSSKLYEFPVQNLEGNEGNGLEIPF
jgi:hypothetical protein